MVIIIVCDQVMAWAVFTFTHPDDNFKDAKASTGEDAMMGALRLATRTFVLLHLALFASSLLLA